MSELQFELLYGHVKGKIPHLYPLMRNYLTGNQSMALVVGGEDAIKMLLEIRGASNAADSPPGTIRGDYAKDQDYGRLIREGKIALNVFHAADSEEEAAKDIAAFFGSGMHG
jgi:nucleoside-diphosphate kinase